MSPETFADAAFLLCGLILLFYLVAWGVGELAAPVPDEWDLDSRGDEPGPKIS